MASSREQGCDRRELTLIREHIEQCETCRAELIDLLD
jgi:hypothetical protein